MPYSELFETWLQNTLPVLGRKLEWRQTLTTSLETDPSSDEDDIVYDDVEIQHQPAQRGKIFMMQVVQTRRIGLENLLAMRIIKRWLILFRKWR